ncbi:hypothetical protein [Mucilaginibacter sp. CSA2-8R]|uniref:hypothetical protein n=1 Tax=Mucilaginibacter sp. CSA2-8R TaxID=3141542 RepID=UPI00315DB023
MEDYSNRLSGYDDRMLILMATVDRGRYHDFAIEAAKRLLADRHIDLTQYNEDFYISEIASGYGAGWEKLIRIMLEELRINGWNCDITVHYKEKYGQFELSLETDNYILNEIIKKHLTIINCSCMICGEYGETMEVAGWNYTLCEHHFIEKYPIIYYIDNKGFTIRKEQYSWEQISEISLLTADYNTKSENFQDIAIAEVFFFDQRETILLSGEWVNWFLFLKTIPSRLAPVWLTGELEKFYKTLKYCPVCQFQSVQEESCFYCGFWMPSILMKKNRVEKKGEVFDENEVFLKEQSYLKMPSFINKLRSLEKSFVKTTL